jgi:type IV fimbrial biogenesis protein FimT
MRQLMAARRSSGFTLIELMVTITLIAILMLLAIPAFGTWSADARVRSTAESLQNALRMAQLTAVARSRSTVFALTNATPAANAAPVANGRNWYIEALPLDDEDEDKVTDSFIQGATVAGQYGVAITGPASLCFNSLGRQVTKTLTKPSTTCTAPTDDNTASTKSDTVGTYTVSKVGASRKLLVRVYLGGRVRMCDAAKDFVNKDDPDGC